MNDKDIYELKLHESISVNKDRNIILRVPNGWIYSFFIENTSTHQTCFVPYNEEFKT